MSGLKLRPPVPSTLGPSTIFAGLETGGEASMVAESLKADFGEMG
jgi:hypothetical protein